jgi:hypothetical protein
MRHLLLIPALLLAACGGGKPEAASPAPGSSATTAPTSHPLAHLLVTTRPAGAQAITAIKASAKPGDTVVVRGRVGGRVDPFIAGKAALILADDEAIAACDKNPDDHCTTPWDYCCEGKEAIAKATCLVTATGADGAVLPHGLAGLGGLAAGNHIEVTATVGADSTADNLVLVATGIHVLGKSPAP